MIKQLLAIFLGLWAFASSPTALAYESRYFSHQLQNICEATDPHSIRGSFRMKNISQDSVEVSFAPLQNREYDFRFVAEKKMLQPGEEVDVHFQGSIFREGKYQIVANAELTLANGDRVGSYSVDLYYLVEKRQVRASTYEELYMKRDVIDQALGDSFSVVADTANLQRGPEYQTPLPNVQRMIDLDPKSIFNIPTDSMGPQPCAGPCPQCPGGGNCPITTPEKDLRTLPYDMTQPPKSTEKNITAVTTAHGEFSYKGMDNLLHPAFGWRARAWRNAPGSGWSIVAEDWIQYNGQWTLNFTTAPGEIRFQYIAANRFFTPMTSAEDTYRWVGPLHPSIPASHNEGSWFADASGGSVRGLGEIYYGGMHLWSKLFWEGEINPLRDSTIKVFFPNTTYDCGDGTGSPWSCASRDGKIWLIPAHASRNGVIEHELSHQINYQYWGNSLPAGSGGSHTLTSCYNPGLALVEGFANFMVFWSQSARGDVPAAGFDFAVENPSSACADPRNKNESWVAAAFWDLHDTHGDGADNLWFIHPGAVPAIFLTAGKKNGMADFHPIYRSRANAEHRTIIDDMFEQNNIIAP
jgi:hypothetical protein